MARACGAAATMMRVRTDAEPVRAEACLNLPRLAPRSIEDLDLHGSCVGASRVRRHSSPDATRGRDRDVQSWLALACVGVRSDSFATATQIQEPLARAAPQIAAARRRMSRTALRHVEIACMTHHATASTVTDLSGGEIYCIRCREPRTPVPDLMEYQTWGRTAGGSSLYVPHADP